MGSFSFYAVGNRKSMIEGKPYKLLVPREFGGQTYNCVYEDYGMLYIKKLKKSVDVYELLAIWNSDKEDLMLSGQDLEDLKTYGIVFSDHPDIYDGKTEHNRTVGIDIGCQDKEMASLKYPLRITNVKNNSKKYEDYIDVVSICAEHQGFFEETVDYDTISIKNILSR